MQIGPSDVIIYAIFGLTIALAVNYYGDLNIPVINKIQGVLIPGINDEESEGSYTYSPKGSAHSGCEASKVFGDTKRQIRQQIKAAKSAGNLQLELDLKQRFDDIKEQQRLACK
jgi:hypothetical protein